MAEISTKIYNNSDDPLIAPFGDLPSDSNGETTNEDPSLSTKVYKPERDQDLSTKVNSLDEKSENSSESPA